MYDLCDAMQKFGKGIGNASRYRIVEALGKGPKTVNQLAHAVKLAQPAVSQHLKVLRESGIVTDERCGKEVRYSLDTPHILGLLTSLSKEVGKPKKK